MPDSFAFFAFLTKFQNIFFSMKSLCFWFRFHWPGIILKNDCLVFWRIYASHGLGELSRSCVGRSMLWFHSIAFRSIPFHYMLLYSILFYFILYFSLSYYLFVFFIFFSPYFPSLFLSSFPQVFYITSWALFKNDCKHTFFVSDSIGNAQISALRTEHLSTRGHQVVIGCTCTRTRVTSIFGRVRVTCQRKMDVMAIANTNICSQC